MKIMNRTRLMAVLLTGTLLGLGSLSANATAVGTAAGTTIGNTASVDYKVGTISQTTIKSSPDGLTPAGKSTDFVVDAKLAIVVTAVDTLEVAATPGAGLSPPATPPPGAILTYLVTNNGNDARGVILTAGQLATGTASPFTAALKDNFQATSTVYVSKTHSATYDPANDTATNIPTLASGDSVYVFVVSSIPKTQVNGDVAVVSLTGQVADNAVGATYATPVGTASADQSTAPWDAATKQTIFADAAGSDDAAHDGKSSARDAYIVKSAALKVSKTATVLTDPVYCTTPGVTTSCVFPAGQTVHSIPGAVMQYSISIANAAGAASAATSIALSDDLTAQTSNLDTSNVASSMKLDPGDGTGSAACASPTCTFTANVVAASVATLAAGKTAVLTFNVTIK